MKIIKSIVIGTILAYIFSFKLIGIYTDPQFGYIFIITSLISYIVINTSEKMNRLEEKIDELNRKIEENESQNN